MSWKISADPDWKIQLKNGWCDYRNKWWNKRLFQDPQKFETFWCVTGQFFDSWVLDVMVEFVTDNFGMISLSLASISQIIKCSTPPQPPPVIPVEPPRGCEASTAWWSLRMDIHWKLCSFSPLAMITLRWPHQNNRKRLWKFSILDLLEEVKRWWKTSFWKYMVWVNGLGRMMLNEFF